MPKLNGQWCQFISNVFSINMKVNMRLDQVLINQLGMEYFISIHFVSDRNYFSLFIYKIQHEFENISSWQHEPYIIPTHFWLRLIGNIPLLFYSLTRRLVQKYYSHLKYSFHTLWLLDNIAWINRGFLLCIGYIKQLVAIVYSAFPTVDQCYF